MGNNYDKTVKADAHGHWHAQVDLVHGDNAFGVQASYTNGSTVYDTSPSLTIHATYRLTHAQLVAQEEARARRKAEAERRAAERKAAAERRAEERKEQFIAAAHTIPYSDLIKDTAPYKGEKIALHGQILQIQQQQGLGGIMLLSVTDEGYGIWDDNVWVDYDQDVPYVEKNIVTVYGTVTGTKSYQTQAGGNTFVPRVHAAYIEGSS